VRIALACPYAWDVPGGVQVHVRGLADGLAARGHETLILAPASGRVAEGDVTVVGRPVRIPYGGKVAPICPSRSSWRRVRDVLDVFEPDVVHAHEPFTPSTSMFATLASPVPVVATFHAFHARSRLLAVAAPLLRTVARRVAAPVAVSEAAAAFVAPVVPSGVAIVPNGVEVERFANARPAPDLPQGRIVLWVGRLDPQKGFAVAVRAFADIARRVPDAHLVVAGDGRDRTAVRDLMPEIRARVHMLGPVPNGHLPGYHAAAEVALAPATGHESFGIVLVESLAAGVPVVATDIDGYREVITDGVDGLLVPPGSARAVADAAVRILEDPALAQRLVRAGRARAATYAWSTVVPAVEAIYRRVSSA
jgi:phosphatidyl-myo-inositol alpha-mannosyltransferase